MYLVFYMAPDDGDVVATRMEHEESGNASTKSRFVVQETAIHWNVVKFRQLYPNTLYARRFSAVFSDGQHSSMCERIEVCYETDLGD